MFNKDHLSDVKFVVFDGDGENESRQMIPAHKFILAISSPVFKAMFYGKLVETGHTIELPDCDYESLLELFRYMYSDEVNLSGSNVMKVLYLAKKYMVPSLANKCVKYVFGQLDASNVFNVLPCAQKYDEKILVDKCWKVIDEDAEAAMKSESFATIDRSLLEAVVERNTLDIAELELFNRVMEWATKKFEEQGIVADGQQKRRILGERVIKSIHFPIMTEEEFSFVLRSGILRLGEVIFKADINSVENRPAGFPKTKRSSRFKRCCRYNSSVTFDLIRSSCPSSLTFTVDCEIQLHGVYLFGEKDSSQSLTLYLERDQGGVLASTGGTFVSKLHRSCKCYGFEVWFEEPVSLQKGSKYRTHVEADHSLYNTNACGLVHCSSGVTFTFLLSLTQSPIAEFIFNLNCE